MRLSRPDPRSLLPFRRAVAIVASACVLACSGTPAPGDELAPRSLFVMKTDGSEVRHVIHVDGYSALGSPRWSHDGTRLVFDARNPQPDANRCFLVGVDGQGFSEVGPGALADWSPDDKQFALAAGTNKSLKNGIWVQDIDGRGRLWLAPGTAPHWSPDGSQIAFINGTLKILDLANGTTRDALERQPPIWRMQFGMDWSPDGTRLAVVVRQGMDDGPRDLLIVDASGSSAPRKRLAGDINDVAWSPDGKTLAVSLRGEARRECRIHLLSADGDDGPVEIPGQQEGNREPAWSPDGTMLAFASARRDISWKPAVALSRKASLEQVKAYNSGGTCYSLAIAPDSRTALLGANMGNRQMQVWDVQTGDVLRHIGMLGIFVAVSPNGKEAACWELRKSSVTYFNLEDGSPIRLFEVGAMVIFLNISGDGSRLVCGSRGGVAIVFDVNTGDEVARLQHDGPVGNGALSPDGKLLASSADKTLYLWDTTSGKKLHQIEHPAMVWGVAYSPDGATVAAATGGTPIGDITDHRYPMGDDNTIRLWNATDGKLVRELKGHEHAVTTLAFSPDGRRLASGSLDKTLRLWDVESGEELDRASGRSWIMKIAYSADGAQLLTAGGNYREAPDTPRLTDVPDERVRVYRIVSAGTNVDQPASPQKN